MLGRVFVGDGEGVVEVGDEGESASVANGVERDVASRQIDGLVEQLGDDGLCQGLAGSDQDWGGEVVVFGLGEQVGGDEFGVGGVVRDDQGFRGAVDRVDADDPVETPFGGGDESVARSEDLVDGGD